MFVRTLAIMEYDCVTNNVLKSVPVLIVSYGFQEIKWLWIMLSYVQYLFFFFSQVNMSSLV